MKRVPKTSRGAPGSTASAARQLIWGCMCLKTLLDQDLRLIAEGSKKPFHWKCIPLTQRFLQEYTSIWKFPACAPRNVYPIVGQEPMTFRPTGKKLTDCRVLLTPAAKQSHWLIREALMPPAKAALSSAYINSFFKGLSFL